MKPYHPKARSLSKDDHHLLRELERKWFSDPKLYVVTFGEPHTFFVNTLRVALGLVPLPTKNDGVVRETSEVSDMFRAVIQASDPTGKTGRHK